ncbi:DUF423 domain-containing protein [Desulfuromonas thiophila]|uniref:Uncharacterized membrane protein YgdD, TMEM256/DUF423 family n=1 Tax=Desulfuromonas thiophila TaxID=57664 RepID=A0A1G7EP46_9BACT|nr:DUF423 domain-containing protein [Desulfuromonas thiophila]MDD3801434.1 DUF423 domain-containing protein [Desulfuromonas thiophila]SDE65490.1 Uncharacterized membrane protein YgdD, TMEM256/DUF423 family [Desulfuromonas thiophila]
MRFFLVLGSGNALLAILLAALAAHRLEASFSALQLRLWDKAVSYQLTHALALLAVALLVQQLPRQRRFRTAGLFFVLGILLFCGSLYLLAATGLEPLRYLTPLGGLCLVAGWTVLCQAALSGE